MEKDHSVEGVLFVGKAGQRMGKLPAAPVKSGTGRRWTCHFYYWAGTDAVERQLLRYEPGYSLAFFEQVTPEDGNQYVLLCTDENGQRVVDRVTTYNSANPGAMLGDAPAVDWNAVRARIAAVRPRIQTSPARDRPQLVGVKTWFWMENWDEVDASLRDAASLAGFDLTITASDIWLRVDPGDGSGTIVTCTREQMTVWSRGGPEDTACGYKYYKKSTGEPGGTWPLKATLVYNRVAWTANGPGGTSVGGTELGTITSEIETVPLVVHEYQAVIR